MKLKTGIEIYMGLPGAGKSTMASVLAMKHIKAGYKVYSNFPIHGTFKLDVKIDIMRYNLENALIIIDEAGIEHDNRDWQKFTKEYTEFYKTHRHYKLRVVLFTQYWDDVDKKIRNLTNKIYVVRKSLIPYCIKCKEIKPFLGISEEKQIVMQYDFKPIYMLGTKLYFVYFARKMFDSWSHRELPEKEEWEVYTIIDKKKQIKQYG